MEAGCRRLFHLAGTLLALGSIFCLGQRIYTPPAPGSAEASDPHPAPAPPAPPQALPTPAAQALPPKPPPPPQPPQPDPLLAGHDVEVGTFYYHRGDYPGALARFQDALKNDPTLPEAACRAGDSELKLKQLEAARADWRRCLKLDAAVGGGKWSKAAQKALAKHPPEAEKP